MTNDPWICINVANMQNNFISFNILNLFAVFSATEKKKKKKEETRPKLAT